MTDQELCDDISRGLTEAVEASGMGDAIALQNADTWVEAIDHLIGMVQAGDDALAAYDWAIDQLHRIGEHLDYLPAEHRMPKIPLDDLLRARVEILEA